MTKFIKRSIIASYFIFLALGALYVIVVVRHTNEMASRKDGGDSVVCPMDAKLCPDGSAVGRVPPSCEFPRCPGEVADDSWKIFSDAQQGVSFRYPENIPAKFVSAQDWPPTIAVTDQKFSCQEGGPEMLLGDSIAKRRVNDRIYCVTENEGAAAGSIYTTYTYSTMHSGKLITLHFTLRFPQCMNYEDPQKTQCQTEQAAFSPDMLADALMATVALTAGR